MQRQVRDCSLPGQGEFPARSIRLPRRAQLKKLPSEASVPRRIRLSALAETGPRNRSLRATKYSHAPEIDSSVKQSPAHFRRSDLMAIVSHSPNYNEIKDQRVTVASSRSFSVPRDQSGGRKVVSVAARVTVLGCPGGTGWPA